MSATKCTDRVTEYAREVVRTGRYPDTGLLCGQFHILACQRHLNDLKRQRTAAFPYYWDPPSSERVNEFAETLTIAEGDAPKPLRLMTIRCFQKTS